MIEWRDDSLFLAAAGDLASAKRIAERYGFCLVKRMFQPDEIARLVDGMRAAKATAGGSGKPEVLGAPAVRWILTDDRVTSLARALLGPELVYYAESSINFESEIGEMTLNPLMVLHADATGTPDGLEAFWQPKGDARDAIYPVYRFAIYTQDYARHSGGLKVVPESHRLDHELLQADRARTSQLRLSDHIVVQMPLRRYGFYNVPSEPGDIVVWNLHTLHSAGALRLTQDPGLALSPEIEAQLWQKHPDLYAPPPGPRCALFFDYGRPAAELDLYIKSRAMLSLKQANRPLFDELSCDDPTALALLRRHGIAPRYDALLLALGWHLVQRVIAAGGNAACLFEGEVSHLTTRFWALCQGHSEYSPYFPLATSNLPPGAAMTPEALVGQLKAVWAFCRAAGLTRRPPGARDRPL
jgi:hypothetical protein